MTNGQEQESENKPEGLYAEHKEAVERKDEKAIEENIAAAKVYFEKNADELHQEASKEYQTWAKEEIDQAVDNRNIGRIY